MITAVNVRTHSPDEAERSLGALYLRARLHDTDASFHFEQSTRGDERANITRLQLDAPATAVLDLEGVVGIGRPRSGRLRADSNGTPLDVERPFVLRPGQVRSWSTELDLTVVNLDLDAFGRFAEERVPAPRRPLRFERVAASSPETARLWSRTLAHATDVFRDDDLLCNDLIRHSAVDLLFSAALTAFAGPPDDVPVVSRQSATVRRALQYIDEHAAEPIGVADIAQAARLSTRGLEAAFRRALDTTPTARLREVRLAHAHDDLLAATPGSDSVAEIARRWGFTHLGRFATHYRATYDRLPRETLGQ